jgi:2-haloacid dehalogenase
VRRDWGAFASAWRALYQPAMKTVRDGERPFVTLDVLHRENLAQLLAAEGIDALTEAEIDRLSLAWHRLDPWPEVVEAMARLKRRFVLASLSNGNVALMVNMARRAGLPWDVILGAEVARAYKPQAEAYDSAARMLGLAPAECLMVAAHPSDLRAAARRGFKTAYVHRPLEEGAGAEKPWPEPGVFDYSVPDFLALAEALGA